MQAKALIYPSHSDWTSVFLASKLLISSRLPRLRGPLIITSGIFFIATEVRNRYRANIKCFSPWNHLGLGERASMSQRYPASCPSSFSSSDDGPRNPLPSANLQDETIHRSEQPQPPASSNWVCDPLLHQNLQLTEPKLPRTNKKFGLQTMLNPAGLDSSQTSRPHNENSELYISKSDQNLQSRPHGLSPTEQLLIPPPQPLHESISSNSLNLHRILTSKSPIRKLSSSRLAENAFNSQRLPTSSAEQHHPSPSPQLSIGSETASDPNNSMTRLQGYTERYAHKYPDTNFLGTFHEKSLKFPTPISTSPKSSPAASIPSPYQQTMFQTSHLPLISQGQPTSPSNIYYPSMSSFGDSIPITGGNPGSLGNTEGAFRLFYKTLFFGYLLIFRDSFLKS